MRRRLLLFVFLPIFGLVALSTWAQQQTRVPVVGLLVPSLPKNHPALQTLRNRLRELGYVEGTSIKYEYRSAEGELGRLPSLAEELVRLHVDVIVAATEPAIWAARKATTVIPIVMIAYSSDPTASGLVDSFAHPGGNLTGIFTRDSELLGKRLELLKETIPGLSRMAVFWDSYSPSEERDDLSHAAHSLKIQLEFLKIRTPADTSIAFIVAKRSKAGAVMVLLSPALHLRSATIAHEALANRLPLIGFLHDFTRAGGLLSYAPEQRDNYYRAAYFIHELLKGATPNSLPVEQVAIPKLAINLKTAKALGMRVPQSVLLRADEVIE